MKELSSDVLILGGGPAGLRAAQECARKGLRTIVVEKKKEIGTPIRTSGATWIDDIKSHGIPSKFFHRIERVKFVSPNEEAQFKNSKKGVCVLDVRGMLQHMAHQAVKRGALLQTGTRALETVIHGNMVKGAVVQTPHGDQQKITARITIDATGFLSLAARKLYGFRGFRRYGLGLEYDLYAPHYPQEELVLLVGSQLSPTGYAWLFPWGSHRVRVGVGITMPDAKRESLSDCLKKLIEEDPRFSAYLRDAGCIEIHQGLVPDEPLPHEPVADGLIIIGDAAAQASALAGEGIRFAMEMGVFAADISAKAIEKGNLRKEFLGKAHDQWNRKWGRNFRIAMEINKRMAEFSDPQWDQAIRYLRRMTDRQFLQFLKTEFSSVLFLSLIARNPDLARRTLIRRVLKELKGSKKAG